jgi:hypothetical protein
MATNISIDKLVYTKSGVPTRELALVESVLDQHYGTKRTVTVVKQSIKATTTVARGTAVDVVLAFTDDIPIKVFPHVPKVWEEVPVKVIADAARKNPVILDIFARHETLETLNEEERHAFTEFARNATPNGADVEIETAFSAALGAHLLAGQ